MKIFLTALTVRILLVDFWDHGVADCKQDKEVSDFIGIFLVFPISVENFRIIELPARLFFSRPKKKRISKRAIDTTRK